MCGQEKEKEDDEEEDRQLMTHHFTTVPLITPTLDQTTPSSASS